MQPILIIALLLAAGPEVEVRTLDGPTVAGRLVDVSVEQVTLETVEGKTTLPAEGVLGLSPTAKPSAPTEKPSIWVELVDGSQIVAQQYLAAGRASTLTLLDGSTLQIETRHVLSVRMQPATEATDKEWQRILEGKYAADVLVIRKDETIDYHQGVAHDISETAVTFELDGEKIPVRRTRVFGLLHYRPERDLPGALCTLATADGSQWAVRKLAGGEELEWTTPSGLSVKRPLAAVTNIDFSGGKIIYVSDLKPDSIQWTPYFGTAQQLPAVAEFYSPRMDQSMAAKAIRLGGEKYAKGLAIHSRTELTYRLPGRFSRFRALAGIDDEVSPNGHVQLIIRGDDKVLFDAPIAGGDKPRSIDLDISGVRRLVILVDFGEKLDVADHLDLAMARISK
jgi:hypothetical protein